MSPDSTFEELHREREETGLELGGEAHFHFQIPGILTSRGTGRWGKPHDVSPPSCQVTQVWVTALPLLPRLPPLHTSHQACCHCPGEQQATSERGPGLSGAGGSSGSKRADSEIFLASPSSKASQIFPVKNPSLAHGKEVIPQGSGVEVERGAVTTSPVFL